MATAAKKTASAVAKANQLNKYTLEPQGIWATISNFLSVAPGRSSGVPLNPQYRLPTPGGLDPKAYDDPVTIPAADIADNPYWKRDNRRAYPRLSVVKQADVVGLLTVGSAAQPKDDVLKLGEAGAKQLVAVKEEGEKGLSTYFAQNKGAFKGVLGPDGLPPLPTSRGPASGKQYEMNEEKDQSYGTAYPCRTFV